MSFRSFNLSEIDAIANFCKQLRQEVGPIYGLVNNAGIGTEGLLATMHNSQIEALFYGNPNLAEESADTYTFGIAVAPEVIPGLQFSIDYYSIKVEDYVNSLAGGTTGVVRECFASLDIASAMMDDPSGPALLRETLSYAVEFRKAVSSVAARFDADLFTFQIGQCVDIRTGRPQRIETAVLQYENDAHRAAAHDRGQRTRARCAGIDIPRKQRRRCYAAVGQRVLEVETFLAEIAFHPRDEIR